MFSLRTSQFIDRYVMQYSPIEYVLGESERTIRRFREMRNTRSVFELFENNLINELVNFH